MKAFYAEEQKRHDPKAFLSSGAPQPNPEQPERVERLLAGARAAGCAIERPRNHGLGPIAAVHTPEYLDFLEHIYRALAAHRGRLGRGDPQHPPDRPQRLLSGLGGRPGRLPHGRYLLPDLGRDLGKRLLERLERGRGGRCRAGGRRRRPMRSADRPATTPSPMSPAASASSTIRRSPRSACAEHGGARRHPRCRPASRQRHAGHLLRRGRTC